MLFFLHIFRTRFSDEISCFYNACLRFYNACLSIMRFLEKITCFLGAELSF